MNILISILLGIWSAYTVISSVVLITYFKLSPLISIFGVSFFLALTVALVIHNFPSRKQ